MNIFNISDEQIKKLNRNELIGICEEFGFQGACGYNGFPKYKELKKQEILLSILNYKKAMKSIENQLKNNFDVYDITYDSNYGFNFYYEGEIYSIKKELNFGNEIYIANGELCADILNCDDPDDFQKFLIYEIDEEDIKNKIKHYFEKEVNIFKY